MIDGSKSVGRGDEDVVKQCDVDAERPDEGRRAEARGKANCERCADKANARM